MIFSYECVGACNFLSLGCGYLQRAATIGVTTIATTTVARVVRIVRIGNVIVCVVWVNAGVIGIDRRRGVEVVIIVVMIVIVIIVVGLGLLGLQLVQRLHVLHVWLVVVIVIVIHSGRSSAVMQEIALSFRFKLRNEARAKAGGTVSVKH